MASAVVEAAVECETFHRLEEFVGTRRFLQKLQQAQQEQQQQSSGATTTTTALATTTTTEGLGAADDAQAAANISDLIRDAMSTSITSPATTGANTRSSNVGTSATYSTFSISQPDDQDYVMIDKQSAVEAMAFFIAQTLMNCPQAFTMPPAKLQEAIIITIQGMKQSKFKRICTAGRHAYRWSALGYSAFQMYSNPWICQAIIQAVWAFSRMTMRSWV